MRPGPMALDTVFAGMHSVIQIQLSQIKTSFGQSRLRSMSSHSSSYVFRLLERVVSHKCLELMMEDLKFARKFGDIHMVCSCDSQITHGIPCPHRIAECIDKGIEISPTEIHQFWKELAIDGDASVEVDEVMAVKRKVARSLMDEIYHEEFPKASVEDQY